MTRILFNSHLPISDVYITEYCLATMHGGLTQRSAKKKHRLISHSALAPPEYKETEIYIIRETACNSSTKPALLELISTSLFLQLISTLREKLAMTMLFHQENVKFIFTTLSNILLASNDLFPFNNILSITLRSRSVEMVHMKSRFVVFFLP